MKRILRALTTRLDRLHGRIALLAVPGLVHGNNVTAQRGVRIRLLDSGKCTFGDDVALDRNSDVTARKGTIIIGARTYIGQSAMLVAREAITIGTDCQIAERVTIRDQDHKVEAGKITADNGFVTAPIHIGNNVWIGANCVVTKGVNIGDNSVIGAGSVVTGDIAANVIAAGSPAKIIRAI